MYKFIALAALLAAAHAKQACTRTYTTSDCSGDATNEVCVDLPSGSSCPTLKCTGAIGIYTEVTCSGVCFPADATVALEDGSSKPMSKVQIGDRVQVGPNKFSDVYMFSHNIPAAKAEFVRITTASNAVLRITSAHYLYVNDVLATAGSVRVGDKITLANGTASTVAAVSSVWSEGIYNPHTLHGDIVVDGVLTSTYTTAVHPTVAHAVLAPLRMLYQAGVNVYSSAVEKAMPLLNHLLPQSL